MRNWIRRLTVSVTVVSGFLFLAGVAKRVWAQQAVEKKFDQLDQNKDGKITPDELRAGELFKRLDLDGNGEITRSEAARALARGKLNDLMKPSESSSSDNPMVKQIEAIAKLRCQEMRQLSMGQGQEEAARKLLTDSIVLGHWLLLQVWIVVDWNNGLLTRVA